jgi:hypothetical protein
MRRNHRRLTGHALTEYVFVIAFVSVLIATAFALGNGTLSKAVSSSKDSIQNALLNMIAAANEAGKPKPDKPM